MHDVNPYVTTSSIQNIKKTLEKRALTIPPRQIFPSPATPTFQNPSMSYGQPMNSAGAPVQQGVGRGRPAGSTGNPGAAPLPQTGVPGQPSAVAQLGGQTSTPQAKGFGNTPTSSTSSAHGHSASIGKAANMNKKSATPGAKPQMPIQTPMSMLTPVKKPGLQMSKLSSAELATVKMAVRLGQLAATKRAAAMEWYAEGLGHRYGDHYQPPDIASDVGHTAGRMTGGALHGGARGLVGGALLGGLLGDRRHGIAGDVGSWGLHLGLTGAGSGAGGQLGARLGQLTGSPTGTLVGGLGGSLAGAVGGYMLGDRLTRPSTDIAKAKEEKEKAHHQG